MLWQLFSDIRCPPFESNANRTILTETFPFSTRLDCPPGLTFKNGLTSRLVECVRPYKWNTNDFMCRGKFSSGNWVWTYLLSAILVSVMTYKNYVNPRTLLGPTFCQERQSGDKRRRTSAWRSIVLWMSSRIQVRNFYCCFIYILTRNHRINMILIV